MTSKIKDYQHKSTYIVEKRFEQLFTGHRIAIDTAGRILLSPCVNVLKFIEIDSGKSLHEIAHIAEAATSSTDESEEYIVTFDFVSPRLVIAYSSGLLRHYSIDIHEDENERNTIRVDSVLTRTWKSLHIGPIARVAIDRTETLTATGGSDGTIKIWDIVHNYCTHHFKEAKGVISTITFAPNYTSSVYHLFASGDDYLINVWNLVNSKHVAELRGHSGKITDLIFADQDGRRLLSASRDKLIIVWNAQTFEKLRTIAIYESIECICVARRHLFSDIDLTQHEKRSKKSNDFLMITAGESGLLRVWDFESGTQLFTQRESLMRIDDDRVSAGNNDDNDQSIAKNDDNDDDDSNMRDKRLDRKREYTLIRQLIYSESRQHLIAISYDNDIVFHDIANLRPVRQLIGRNDEILDVALIGDAQTHLAAATNSPKIKVFELATANCFLLLGHTDIVLCLRAFAQDPFLLASSSKDNSVRVWRFDSHCTSAICVFYGTGHTHSVTSLATSSIESELAKSSSSSSPSSNLFFLSGSEDTTIKYWKLPESESEPASMTTIVAKFTQSCHEKAINSIDVSPNNQLIVTGSQDKTAKIWMLPNLRLHGVIRGHKKGIWHVKFSPVDQVVATCSADATIKIWSIADCACVKTFQGHTSSVLTLSFIDRGMQFVSSGSDGNVKIWNLKSNECVATFDAHDGKVWAMTISDDEERLVTGSDDSRIAIWRNVTETVREQAEMKREQNVEREQALSNFVQKRAWLSALRLAIRMEHPLRALNMLRELLLDCGSIDRMIETIRDRLRHDQLLRLLEYAVHWNTNAKHCVVAHCVIRAVLERTAPDELMRSGGDFHAKVDRLLPYCERHMKRIGRLRQYAMFADFVYEKMKLPDNQDLALN